MKQKGKKWAGEERGQGNNSEVTNTRKDKCEKRASILFLEKYKSQLQLQLFVNTCKQLLKLLNFP